MCGVARKVLHVWTGPEYRLDSFTPDVPRWVLRCCATKLKTGSRDSLLRFTVTYMLACLLIMGPTFSVLRSLNSNLA